MLRGRRSLKNGGCYGVFGKKQNSTIFLSAISNWMCSLKNFDKNEIAMIKYYYQVNKIKQESSVLSQLRDFEEVTPYVWFFSYNE